ncbi:hypothetical protein BASA81_004231 [Batrachochytrium salamandrivorans]|nr:hypothetical protein BASA81_004231 [Batrachochytrium salamandrivorans]
MEALRQTPVVRIGLHFLLVHFVFRVLAFLNSPTFYDENPYKLKLLAKQQRQQDDGSDGDGGPSRKARKKNPSSRARSSSPVLTAASSSSSLPIILVTGSSGRIGSEVVKQLAQSNLYQVRAVDLVPPKDLRRCDSPLVEYVELNLVLCEDWELQKQLVGVSGVVHCAGLFAQHEMMNTELHNSLHFLTAKLLALAKQSSTCRAFCHSGSVFVCHNGKANLNAIPANTPYVAKPSTFWVRCQIEVEKMVIQANDSGFATNDVRSEFLYMKNAAHAHFCAMQALLSNNPSRAAGSVNIITQSPKGETCTNLEFWQHARRRLGVMRSFVILPTWIFYFIAAWVQLFHRFFCGQVFPQNPMWNSNWAVLDHIAKDSTFLGQVEAMHAIGYRPIYSNDSSFDDLAKEHQILVKTRTLGHDPREDIDWEPREMPGRSRNLFKIAFFALSGPGASWHECALMAFMCAFSTTFGLVVSYKYHFTAMETVGCVGLSNWGMTGSVISIGPNSKRWFHMGGQLGMYMLVVMFLDLVGSLVLFEVMFTTSMEWSLMVGLVLASAMLILTVVVPLSQQRSYAILMCLLFGSATFLDLLPPVRPGMEWFLPLSVLKFLVCHSPRHEPYI